METGRENRNRLAQLKWIGEKVKEGEREREISDTDDVVDGDGDEDRQGKALEHEWTFN